MDILPVPNVLVVDDNEDDLRSLADFLETQSYSYQTVTTGQDAVALVEEAVQAGNAFNVILMDQVLGPGSNVDGISAIPRIKEISPSSEVVIMTAYGDRAGGMEARRAGAYRYIYKPTSLFEIADIIEYIDSWRQLEDQLNEHRAERSYLQQIVKSVRYGISIIDRSWRILYLNDKQREMLPHADVGGICWVEYNQTDAKKPCPWCPVRPIFEKGEKRHYSITISPHESGVPHYYDVEAVPIYDENGRVIAALEAYTDVTERETLYSMQKGMHGTLRLDERLRIILESIRNLGYDRARLYLLSEDEQYFEGKLEVGGGLKMDITQIRLHRNNDGFSKELLEKKKPIIFRTPWKYPPQHATEIGKDKLNEWLDMPLIDSRARVIGKISIDNLTTNLKAAEDPWVKKKIMSKADISRLKPLIGHAADAIARSREYEGIQLKAEQLRNLRTIDTEITIKLEMDAALSMIVDSCMQLTGALSCFVRLRRGKDLVIGAGRGIYYKNIAPKIVNLSSEEDKDAVSVRAVKSKQPVFENWLEENTHRMRQKEKAKTQEEREFFEKVKIWGSFPLQFGEEILGVLSVESDREDFFTESMKSLIFDFCRRAAIAIRNAQLYEDKVKGLEARSRFMRSLSHDLKAPLSHIQRHIDILKLSSASEEMRSRALKIINDELNWYDQMFDKLMTFSRTDVQRLKLKKEESELRSIIEGVMEIWSVRMDEKNLIIKEKFPESEVMVIADGARLREAVNILLENAVKYTPKNGRITLRIKDEVDKVVVEVEDTGVGIADEHKDKIFDLFYTVDAPAVDAKGGAGIGLSTFKHIVEEHGGEIGFESRVGIGSRFWFSLPKEEAKSNEKT